ncbi:MULTISPECIES: ArsR/SmtB family transcription factor [Vibrio]|uniref:ArsR/SmtB family transcription factor n=1 Tax=Vibrio TaxID=662 RepID=UPI000C168A02|nr:MULTISPECIES: metalloregulator ArsR/SmtB family transcription factor [Vibrio]NAX04748.1 metalloregulator ArsR/SmtB family transcription factor [Vibrio sp. V30_P3S12P165]NAX37806.1 metalloregulator ArsR/SmtB family transcription factor [Vibrio sp. V27_P1S3P104]NAX40024.1 metalloregulator ArsR/SmtB family transcription factor [Vibrio sp. V26_P1S5P106]NNN43775.1 helix-turn-helix transcriptional regulator [Vibrio sp. 1-1(7)]NNN71599.1 helix-turn-helix transcriptional regulator [Vibrio sp. 12-2(
MDGINVNQMHTRAVEVAELLSIMAHPERLMVVCQLTQGEVGVTQLMKSSSLSQSAFSQHLAVLRKHGLIQARKSSQQVFYSLTDSRLSQFIHHLQAVFCS